MTRTCHTSEEVVFDEHTIDSTIADIEIEIVFDFSRSNELHSLDMLDDCCYSVGREFAFATPAAFQFVHIITKVSSYPSIDSVARTLQLNRDLCYSLTIVEVNENAPSIQFAPSTTPDGGRFDIHQVVW